MEFAVEIAEAAGEITLQYYQQDIEIETKADSSPVTVADRGAEEYLRAQIEKRFPEDGIYGEEFGVKEGSTGRRWTLDPIDGTKTFIRGVPLYGTMIAIEEEGRSKVGVIRFPATGQTLCAYEGGGCYVNGKRCQVSEVATLGEASAMTTSLDYFDACLSKGALERLIVQTKLQRTWGDCYGYLLVATGNADICIDPIVEIHDFSPLIPIITEAGGKLTNMKGEIPQERCGIVATNGILHEAALKLLNG